MKNLKKLLIYYNLIRKEKISLEKLELQIKLINELENYINKKGNKI